MAANDNAAPGRWRAGHVYGLVLITLAAAAAIVLPRFFGL
jgi:hypothetical protein